MVLLAVRCSRQSPSSAILQIHRPQAKDKAYLHIAPPPTVVDGEKPEINDTDQR